jgi:hypothetical protein
MGKDDVHKRRKLKTSQVMKFALIRDDRMSVLPVLYDIFGEDKLFEFLRLFGGVSILVPSIAEFEDAARDAVVYCELKKCSKDTKEATVSFLADEYGISKSKVWEINEEMETIVEDLVGLDVLDVMSIK